MVHVGLLARLEAKPGKEAAVAELLKSALPLANAEAATAVWFAKAPELLAHPPVIERVDVLAAKLAVRD